GFVLHTLALSRLERLLFPWSLAMRFRRLVKADSLVFFNYPRFAALLPQEIHRSIGVFHGVEWDTDLLSYVWRESKYRYGFIKGPLMGAAKYMFFRGVVPHLVRQGISKLTATVSVDSNLMMYLPAKLRDKVKVIHNYVDTGLFSPSSEPRFEAPLRILVPRNLNVARGVYMLPEICSYLRRLGVLARFTIVGTGPVYPYLRKRIMELEVEDCFVFTGHVGDRAQMSALYNECDIVLIPSVFSEGTSLAMLEGMASGRLVAATDIGGLKEIGVHGREKLVVQPNVRSIAEVIMWVMDNRSEAHAIAKRSREYCLQNFSKELWNLKWNRVLDDVLGFNGR
ncbi:MAG: glycosyltransferase family 4 protein, partial [Chitinophagales bacterium]